ncbi:hypothetical protein O3P69_006461 [Scylla paramamosain]|uniref:Uncharacterized protein n=1 Tax=Scylla paramamosain TaxID=85552 RepID=A0AAW0U430_SCYPA
MSPSEPRSRHPVSSTVACSTFHTPYTKVQPRDPSAIEWHKGPVVAYLLLPVTISRQRYDNFKICGISLFNGHFCRHGKVTMGKTESRGQKDPVEVIVSPLFSFHSLVHVVTNPGSVLYHTLVFPGDTDSSHAVKSGSWRHLVAQPLKKIRHNAPRLISQHPEPQSAPRDEQKSDIMTLRMVLMAAVIAAVVTSVISEELMGQYVAHRANFLNDYSFPVPVPVAPAEFSPAARIRRDSGYVPPHSHKVHHKKGVVGPVYTFAKTDYKDRVCLRSANFGETKVHLDRSASRAGPAQGRKVMTSSRPHFPRHRSSVLTDR